MSGILGEYTEVFLEESEDQIEELNANLLKLETDHTNPEIINDIFRAAHSLKSSAAFVGLYNLSDLAHKMENLLQKIREDKLSVNITLVNLLFECFDLIKDVIDAVGRGEKIETPFDDMIAKLVSYEESQIGTTTAQPKPEVKSIPEATPVATQSVQPTSSTNGGDFTALQLDDDEIQELEEELKIRKANAFDVHVILKSDTPMKGLRFTLILQNLKTTSVVFKSAPDLEQLERGIDQSSLIFLLISTISAEDIKKLIAVDMVEMISIKQRTVSSAFSSEKSKETSTKSSQSSTSQKKDKLQPQTLTSQADKEDAKGLTKSIKVSSEKLDQLMNTVGELVITNSGFQKIYDDLVRSFGDDTLFAELKSKIDQINRISKDLQTGIMNTRMVPIGSVFNRFTRLVRDLSVETGKKVQLNLMGENTELDKKVVDMIGEPLIHLIRNSIDHGLESPEDRIKAGKPEYGTVELNAYQGGNNIMVEIKDDGRGLNKSRILKKAIENGLTTQSDAANLSDNDIYQFIFAPGFSTAAEVTDLSGRGVGMNVVNKLIQDFKGKILINTNEGIGASFTLCFPQALAIIPSILVSMEEEIYAFPLSEVFETIRIKKDQINTLEGHEIINLRGEVLPIYRLNRLIGLTEQQDSEESPVVIVNYNSRKLGFIVGDLLGKHETVIKTLEKNYKNIKGLTGASIMGDGTIILVLDIAGLIELTNSTLEDESLKGAIMKRLNTNKSSEIGASTEIYKSLNATNIYNSKLLEMAMQDKSKKKKDKEKKRVQYFHEETEPVRQSVSIEQPRPEEKMVMKDKQENQEFTQSPKQQAEEKIIIPAESAPEYNPEEEEKNKAKEVLKGLSNQTKERVESLISDRKIDDWLSNAEIRKLESVVNTGMMNAGLVLSQLVGSNVELFMPEIMLTTKEDLTDYVRDSDEHFFGMKVRMNGDLNGNLLMMFSEEKGKELANKLLKSNESSDLAKKMSEDSLSVLMEISNIVCASVMNSLSNKAKAQIMPSVPELVTGNFKEVIDAVKPEKTKFLSMHTEFVYEGDNLIGNLIFLPDFEELIKLISQIN